MKFPLVSLALVALLGATTPVAQTPSDNWPQWRGPNRDGISADTGLLQSWPDGGPRKLFTASGMGAGFSSVAVVDGRLYTLGDFRGGGRDGQFALAFDASDGRPLWATRIGDRHEDEYGGPRGTPSVDAGMVYVMSSDGNLVALQSETGERVWSKNLPRDFGARRPTWLFAESPLIDGDRIVFGPGASRAAIVTLDKKTGREVWRAHMPDLGPASARAGVEGPDYSSVVISEGGGVKQYVRLSGRGLISVRADDGWFLWGSNSMVNGTANIATPIIKDNLVFASTSYGAGSAMLELAPSANNRVTATQRYFLDGGTFQNHHGGMIEMDGYVYGGHGLKQGFPKCIELTTGKIMWGGNFRNAGQGSAAISAADGHLYFRYENGMMILIEATPDEYREKGQFKIPGVRDPSWSHPVITGGRMYLREQDALHVYDVRGT